MPRFALGVWHESYKCVKYLHQDRKNTLLFRQAGTCYSDYSPLEVDANMPGPQTHTKVSTWHFWHICKGPTDNQLMWESKSHAKESLKNLRSAQAQGQAPWEQRWRRGQGSHAVTAHGLGSWGGAAQPTLLSSLSGGASASIPVAWHNLNVSFWTETGSNYAKKLEDSQDSKAFTLIPTTKMHLCSHRRAFASWSGHKALPSWAKGREQDIKVRSCAPLAGRTAPEPRDKQRWSHTTYTPCHP